MRNVKEPGRSSDNRYAPVAMGVGMTSSFTLIGVALG